MLADAVAVRGAPESLDGDNGLGLVSVARPRPPGWRLPPEVFERVCVRAKSVLDTQPAGGLEKQMVLLDNWNEFGEGHYTEPHRQYGFAYLDAFRRVFPRAPERHVDWTPDVLGLGPYDGLFRASNGM